MLVCILSFVVLVKLSVLAKWKNLPRKIPMRKPNWRDHLHKTQAKKCLWLSWCNVSFHCFMVCLSCPSALHDTLYTDVLQTPMAQYSLFVLKVPLTTNQLTTNSTMYAHYLAKLQESKLWQKYCNFTLLLAKTRGLRCKHFSICS